MGEKKIEKFTEGDGKTALQHRKHNIRPPGWLHESDGIILNYKISLFSPIPQAPTEKIVVNAEITLANGCLSGLSWDLCCRAKN
jgi:hypothetical protein